MTNPTAPSPFAPTIPNFQTAWDSTSISWLKTCPKLYHYQMVEGWSPKSKSVHLKFGGWYASGVERYAHLRAAGTPHNTAVLSVVRWALAETWLPQHDPTCPRCLGTGLATGADPLNDPPTTCSCLAPRGWESGDETKNRYTLVRTLVWNLDDRESSPWHTVTLANGKPAVELSFNFHAFDLDEHAIHLCGHMDEIVDNGGQRFVKDDKTTKSALTAHYFAGYTPDDQMTLYTLAGKIILGDDIQGVLVRAAQIGVGFARFATQPISRPKAILEEWLSDLRWWVGQARNFALTNHWPMNQQSCSKYSGCAFRKVCSVSPSHRKAWLEQDFEKRLWNPLQARGDDL